MEGSSQTGPAYLDERFEGAQQGGGELFVARVARPCATLVDALRGQAQHTHEIHTHETHTCDTNMVTAGLGALPPQMLPVIHTMLHDGMLQEPLPPKSCPGAHHRPLA